ncbi:MAG: ACP S-malonyltransferase [Planctomycetaceae bacterium]
MSRSAFLFPGQGAQKVGMGWALADELPAARALFDQAREILGYDLAKICFEGPAEELDRTDISQPAIFVTSLAALERLRTLAPEAVNGCGMTAGLSLGEYTALVFAGSLSFADGLRVVQLRGQAMQAAAEANPSGMVSILMLDREQVEAICSEAGSIGSVHIANLLCPGNTVVSGTKAACDRAVELAERAGGKVARLPVAGAFHTAIMHPADQRLKAALANVRLERPRISVYSNVDASPHADPDEIRGLLVRQVVEPVLWEGLMRAMLAAGAEQFYEVGPGKVLKGLLKRIDRARECQSVGDS